MPEDTDHQNTKTTKTTKTAVAADVGADTRTYLAEDSQMYIDITRRKYRRDGHEPYYPNQRAVAEAVVQEILEGKARFQTVVAQFQSGKTGAMFALRELCLNHPNVIHPQHTYLVGNLSSTEWVNQTKERMPDDMERRIFHRNDTKRKLLKELEGKTDVLIIVDEAHMANKVNMSLDSLMQELGLKDIRAMRERNVHMVFFTATPNRLLEDVERWNETAATHIMQPGTNYVGLRQLFENDQAREYQDLYCPAHGEAAIESLKEAIEERFDADKPKWHIVRTRNKKGVEREPLLQRFMKIFGTDDYAYVVCDSKSEEGAVSKLIVEPPKTHTFIFVKEFLRCAVTLSPKYNVGVLYERVSGKTYDDVVCQSFLGRLTGYDICPHNLVYTSLEALRRYVAAWDAQFDSKSDAMYVYNVTGSKKTFVDPDNYANSEVPPLPVQPRKTLVNEKASNHRFDTEEEARAYAKSLMREKNPGARGPNKHKGPRDDGFYETAIRATRGVYSVDQITNAPIHHLNSRCVKERSILMHPCYEDPTDVDTLLWLVLVFE